MERLTTTIDQHQGNHPTGLRVMALTQVVTECGCDQPECQCDIAALHDARVALASLDADQRAEAIELVTRAQPEDADAETAATMAAVEEVQS